MTELNNYLNRLNELSNLIYVLQDQTDETEKRETAAIVLGLIYSAANLEAAARIQLKETINK